MAERLANPQDSIDLILLLQSYGEDIGTLYPRAYVYGPDNTEINGSPFDLTHIANNLYIKSNAFQVGDSGIYKVVYIVYEDAAHTTKSSAHGEQVEIINVKIQSTTGLGGYGSIRNGGDVIVDLDPVMKVIKDTKERLENKIKKLEETLNAGLKVDIPTQDFKPILDEIKELKLSVNGIDVGGIDKKEINEIKSSIKTSQEKLITAIKKNRTAIIKYKFDKSMLKPMLESLANSDLKLVKGLRELEVNMIKTIDMKNEEANKMFNSTLNKKLKLIEAGLNALNESVRKKLKVTLEGMRALLFVGKQPKQNINITLKKDEL